MAQIAVTILDPSNKRSAHLVETRLPIRDLIPPIVAQLGLPAQANYQLFLLGNESALPAEKSLVESGIPAGTELQLKPVRNQILKIILEKFYDEAKGYVEDQAWDLAKGKLEALFALDPYYPDPLALEKAVAAHVAFMRTIPPTQQFIGRTNPNPLVNRPAAPNPPPPAVAPAKAAPIPASSATAGATRAAAPVAVTTTAPSSGGGLYQLGPQATKGGRTGCLRIGLMIIGVLIAGALAYVGVTKFLPGLLDDLAQRTGINIPGATILGTGDVQVTLRWQGTADLDLHVIDPNGEEIWFQSPQSASGGSLDVDANGNCEGERNPVENIYWPTSGAPSGEYEVKVNYYQACDAGEPTPYEVTVTLDGNVVDDIHAIISNEGETHPVANFQYPP